MAALGFSFERRDVKSFFELVEQLQLGPLPTKERGSEAIMGAPTPANLTFGRKSWPSVASAVLLLYLTISGFVGRRFRVCQLPGCGRFFLSEKKWARWCSVAHRVAGSRVVEGSE
jgi:hypothetical protein